MDEAGREKRSESMRKRDRVSVRKRTNSKVFLRHFGGFTS